MNEIQCWSFLTFGFHPGSVDSFLSVSSIRIKLVFLFQNSLANRQAISDALNESFATLDFGPELSSSDDDTTVAKTESTFQAPVPVSTTAEQDKSTTQQLSADEKSDSVISQSPKFSSRCKDQVRPPSPKPRRTDIGAILQEYSEPNIEIIPPPPDQSISNDDLVTNFDESVTPIHNDNAIDLDSYPLDKSLPDWSIPSIPDPPSGFKDSTDEDLKMIPEPYHRDILVKENAPTITGPMKFSINSYTERTLKEEPYQAKLSRVESMSRGSNEGISTTVPKVPAGNVTAVAKSESFSLARFNGNSTIAGKSC